MALAQTLAPLAVAVHNAGSNNPAPLLRVSQTRFEGHWREHTLGGFQIAQPATPAILDQGAGTLIFTGAPGSLRGKADFSPFADAYYMLQRQQRSAWTQELDPTPWSETFWIPSKKPGDKLERPGLKALLQKIHHTESLPSRIETAMLFFA